MDVIDDPQAIKNQFFQKHQYSSGKELSFATPPFLIDGLEKEDLNYKIRHGECTREILTELNYSRSEIDQLETEGVIYSFRKEKK